AVEATTINLAGVSLHLTLAVAPTANTAKSRQARAERQLDQLAVFSRSSYRQSEQPVMSLPKRHRGTFLFVPTGEIDWQLTSVTITDADGKKSEAAYHLVDQTDGSDLTTLLTVDTAHLHAGKYNVRVTMRDSIGSTAVVTKS